MEIEKTIEEINTKYNLNDLLNSLSKLYNLNTKEFLNKIKIAPQLILKLIRDSEFYKGENDTLEHLKELNYCYKAAIRESESNIFLKEFTLRNFHDLQEFIMFLNKMLYLNEISKEQFIKIFPFCPEAYWDKIDDLRETSIKYGRDSLDFIECLLKCKKISFLYSESVSVYDENEEV